MFWRVFGGAALIVAGLAAFIEAHSHQPETQVRLPDFRGANVLGTLTLTGPTSNWSRTAYDLVRIGAWALLVFGVLLVIVGLIGYARRPGA